MSDVVEKLKETVDTLEKRIVDLESRLKNNGSSSGSSANSESIRMILIGPPGAGKWHWRCIQNAPRACR